MPMRPALSALFIATTVIASTFMGVGMIAGGPYYCAQANLNLAVSQCMTAGDLVYDIEGEHSQITNFYGSTCTKLGEPFINNCKYDAAGAILQHIYKNSLTKPANHDSKGQIYSFDQAAFLGGSSWSLEFGLGHTGFVYVPKQCQNAATTCKLHVAFHGCEMTQDDIGELYVKYGGYNSWADANDFVVLYPQAVANDLNPKGCWDWWGYAGVDYASNLGVQTSTVKRIIDALLG